MFTQITASAGAGKTYTLTHLFLERLQLASHSINGGGCALGRPSHDYGLPEIMAATFTNKAASEMKDRVILALKENALAALKSGNPENPYESWLTTIFKQASLLNIRTIDSLLFLLVRLSALDLKLPPDISPSFSESEYYTPLYDVFMADIAAYTNGLLPIEDATTAERYDGFSLALEEYYKALVTYAKHDGFSLKDRLHNDVFYIVQRLLAQDETPATTGDVIHTIINALHSQLLESCQIMLAFIEKEELTVHKALLNSIEKALQSRPYEKLTNGKFTQVGHKDPAEIVTKKSKNAPSDQAQEAYITLCGNYELFCSKIPVLLNALPLIPLLPLAREMHHRIHANIQQSQLLPAESIPGLAVDILSGEHGVSDALCRMGNRLHHIFLDEFQDTSVVQWKAIEPLVIEALSKGGSFTYVGDVKQAIYSWRNGEIRLFDGILETAHQLQRTPTRSTLDKNWRSSPAIIQFNNAFFSLLNHPPVAQRALEVMLPSDTPEDIIQDTQKRLCDIYSNVYQHLPPQDKRPEYTHEGQVHLYTIHATTSEQLLTRIQKRLVPLVHELLSRWEHADITILTRSGDEAAHVASWLTNENIPVITENSFMLADNPLVSRLISLLAFVDYPYDDLALWEFLTGEECFGRVANLTRQELDEWLAEKRLRTDLRNTPIFQLFRTDFPELWNTWIAPFHNKAGLMTAYDMLHESIRVYDLFTLHPTDEPFLTRLLELAHYAETEGISSLAGFLQFWSTARKDEKLPSPKRASAITIMTMHKAKGLEFPVVILPFQHGGKGRDTSLTVDNSFGFPFLTTLSKHTPVPYYDKEATKAIECLNLLYVAWTRPQYELHSFITSHGHPAMLSKGLNVLLEEFTKRHLEGYILEECKFEEPEQEDVVKEDFTHDTPYEDDSFPATFTAESSLSENLGKEPTLLMGEPPLVTKMPTDPSFSNSLEAHDSVELFPPSASAQKLTNLRAPQPSHPNALASNHYLMGWLPDLKIFRTNLENFTFTPTQRGDLFHLCLEHLLLSPNSHDNNANNIANAIQLGIEKFPFALPDRTNLKDEITQALTWFSTLPQAADWLANGLREQSLLNHDNQVYRVDLLVPEESTFRAVDYKTGGLGGHENNMRQVKNYMELLSRIKNAPICGTLVYLDLQQVFEVV